MQFPGCIIQMTFLKLCYFKPNKLLKPLAVALHVCDNSRVECADLICCVNQNLTNDLFKVNDIGEDCGKKDGDAPEVPPVDSYPDGLVPS